MKKCRNVVTIVKDGRMQNSDVLFWNMDKAQMFALLVSMFIEPPQVLSENEPLFGVLKEDQRNQSYFLSAYNFS